MPKKISKILWNERFMLGIDTLDHQHIDMVNLYNQVIEYSLDKKSDYRKIKKSVEGLFLFLDNHFMTEEIYMLKSGFPKYHDHKNDHDFFMARASVYKTFFSDSDYRITPELIWFLNEWVHEHIQKKDLDLANHLKEYREKSKREI